MPSCVLFSDNWIETDEKKLGISTGFWEPFIKLPRKIVV